MTSLFTPPTSTSFVDEDLEAVAAALRARKDLFVVVQEAIRKSLDEVIDGPRTGRYRVEELEKTEKTYIGTKLEIVLRDELSLDRGLILDNLVAGREVDTKFSLTGAWMIPREAVGHLCLLVHGSDSTGTCGIGLLRMTEAVLTQGSNQDGKRSVSAFGKQQITWLAQGPMLRNFMLDVPNIDRDAILSAPSGRQAIQELFTRVRRVVIPRRVIEQVAQQRDYMKRAREAKAILAEHGITVLCATYMEDREEFIRNGFVGFERDDWLSL